MATCGHSRLPRGVRPRLEPPGSPSARLTCMSLAAAVKTFPKSCLHPVCLLPGEPGPSSLLHPPEALTVPYAAISTLPRPYYPSWEKVSHAAAWPLGLLRSRQKQLLNSCTRCWNPTERVRRVHSHLGGSVCGEGSATFSVAPSPLSTQPSAPQGKEEKGQETLLGAVPHHHLTLSVKELTYSSN